MSDQIVKVRNINGLRHQVAKVEGNTNIDVVIIARLLCIFYSVELL